MSNASSVFVTGWKPSLRLRDAVIVQVGCAAVRAPVRVVRGHRNQRVSSTSLDLLQFAD
jgi:hypothetical protein